MKVWIKYLIGAAIGIGAAVLIPFDNPTAISILSFLTELFIRFGRYLVVPMVFCTAIVSFNKMRNTQSLLKTSAWTFSIIILSSVMIALVGLLSILVVKLPRIPITVATTTEVASIDIKGMILSLFPYSAFDVLREGSFLLVSFILAAFIGWESASDQTLFKPAFSLADSFSQLFYNISIIFTEVMSVFMIALMCYWVVTFKGPFATGIYTPMIIMFAVDFVIIAAVIYPLIIRFVCHDPHPYRVLYASIAPMILAFVSGDSNLVLPLSIRHGKESLGIKRGSSGFTYPLFSIFARGGSALVTTISFILIWRSYSRQSIPFGDITMIYLISLGLSFLMGACPSGGAFMLLTILCQWHGKGFETSYLLLQPAAIIICSFATVLDTATAMFGSYIVAVKTKMVEHHTIQHFI
ncbi:MAG: cation:dicarboxylase symporter family transporter [Treponema sp.]|nr:cation:dicarboxylase symporter family transporter [Treponema sp.]